LFKKTLSNFINLFTMRLAIFALALIALVHAAPQGTPADAKTPDSILGFPAGEKVIGGKSIEEVKKLLQDQADADSTAALKVLIDCKAATKITKPGLIALDNLEVTKLRVCVKSVKVVPKIQDRATKALDLLTKVRAEQTSQV
jgi:hypothetical protein